MMERRPPSVLRRATTVGVVSTYPPNRCGIGRFTAALTDALSRNAPFLDLDIVRIVDRDEDPVRLATAPTPGISMEFDPDCPVSLRTARKHLDRCDIVLVQHEYGIFGKDDGMAVLDMVDHLGVPLVAVLHTVLAAPTDRQRHIVEGLAQSGHIVVPSEAARDVLLDRYAVSPAGVSVIPHGSSWSAAPPHPDPRRNLISWGLLGPGKGFERATHALAELTDLDPPVRYQIVGQTHPKVLRHSGQAYREMLQQLAEDLGVAGAVEFVDRYVGDGELYSLVTAADLVIAPYDNSQQISSGVLTEAVTAGRPVVATCFPHAQELLRTGAGIVVDHDPGELAHAIRGLLTDPHAYATAASSAGAMSRQMSWDAVASGYARLLWRMLQRERIIA